MRCLVSHGSSMWRRGSRRAILLSPRTTLRVETASPTEIDEASHKRKHQGEGFNLLLTPGPIDVDNQSARAATPGHQPSTPSTPSAGDPAVPQEVDGTEPLVFAVGRSIQNGERVDDPEAMSVWTATRRHHVPAGRPSKAQRQQIQHASQHVVAEVLIFNRDEMGFASGRLVEKRQLLTLYATQMEWEAFMAESLANGWTKVTGQRL
ncbi:uncharacterized protein J3D65DRAFT_670252 [Phyllosticta citribraziliensis]|uniref:Uncharacterized protein n=1 Tax=Phyllosticta citribraziliensis TaxID=989973 RepID=A0ABR1LCP5_9PEZI